MKPYIAVGAILLVILNGLLLIPATGGHTVPIATLALVIALLVLVVSLVGGKNDAPNPARADCNTGTRTGPDPASSASR